MVNKCSFKLYLLAAVFLAVLCVFWVRLFSLQVLSYDRYIDLAESRHKVMVPISADRGKIYDRKGEILATSVMGRSVFLNPAEITDPAAVSRRLAPALGLEARQIADSIEARRSKHFLWIKRLVTQEEEAAVRAAGIKGAYVREEPMRFYPNGVLLAQVLGFTGVEQRGLAGIEFALDDRLRGRDGFREERRDGLGRPIQSPQFEYQPAVNGESIVLTVDTNIQDFLEAAVGRCLEQYGPESVTGIVMDPLSGEILALAERPAFDPNSFADYPAENWRVRAITDPFEPGSMFKPFVFAGGLEEKTLRVEDVIFCENGAFTIGKRLLHDHHPYGRLTAREVIIKSSNIGMAKIGLSLGTPVVYKYVRAFGFGRKTGIELSSEEPGYLTPFENWSNYTLTSVPMGHEISVTALQMAAAFSTFANGGYLVRPRLVRGVIGPEGSSIERADEPEIKSRVLAEETARTMLADVLHKVVKEGTGRLADLEDYALAGKTGTAQKLVDGQYSHSKYVSSFICTGPVESPRVVVLIVVNAPSRGASLFGGTAAAPYAAEVAKATLDYMFIDGRRRSRPMRFASAAMTAGAEGSNAP